MKARLTQLLRNLPRREHVVNGIHVGKKLHTAETIAEHLIEQGVIALPCKLGQTIFVICNTVERIKLEIKTCIYETKIDHISIGAKGAEFHMLYRCITHPDCDWFIEKDIGKTVFLTR